MAEFIFGVFSGIVGAFVAVCLAGGAQDELLEEERDIYKKAYEDICKKHTELLDKYEEIYSKNCELEKYIEITRKQ